MLGPDPLLSGELLTERDFPVQLAGNGITDSDTLEPEVVPRRRLGIEFEAERRDYSLKGSSESNTPM